MMSDNSPTTPAPALPSAAAAPPAVPDADSVPQRRRPARPAEGRLAERDDDHIVLTVPETDYRLHLRVDQPVTGEIGQLVAGHITAKARRVDVVPSGGRYIEPVYGRPRRLQGRIVGGDPTANTLLVDCAVPVACTLMPAQSAGKFFIGQMVSFDVEPGATFHPQPR